MPTALPVGQATAPCGWPVSYAACTSNYFTEDDGSQTEQDISDQALFEEMASTFLWEWTGRRYGACDEVLRPCRRGCDQIPTFWAQSPMVALYGLVTGSAAGLEGFWPVWLANGVPAFLACGTCGLEQGCGCKRLSSIRLPGPVASVTSVVIDGATLDPSQYRLEGQKLVRLDGHDWPWCQDLAAEPGQPDTWTVSYVRGIPVPTGGQVAAGLLATELAKAACGDGSCMLPQRVQTVTRQGVTMAMLDDFSSSVEKGYTGLWVVDSWIASVMKPPQSAIVVSPDYRRPTGRY